MAKKATAKKATAKNPTATAADQAVAKFDWSQMEGKGLEEVSVEDIILPRLTMLNSLSDPLNPSSETFIKDAKQGQICISSLDKVFDSLVFIPVLFRKEFNEWTPRTAGGPKPVLSKTHATRAILEDCDEDEWPPVLPNKHEIVETANIFGLAFLPGQEKAPFRCFIAFMRTQLKKGRRWVTKASSYRVENADGTSFQAPLFYKSYNLDSVHEQNASGNWYGWRITTGLGTIDLAESLGINPNEVIKNSLEFINDLKQDSFKMDRSFETEAAAERGADFVMDEDGNPMPDDGDIPDDDKVPL